MQPTLYLMVGYPGAGKTTASQVLHNLTGAEHLWADHVRKEQFGHPNYSKEESDQLYEALNQKTSELLAQGKSVIFDTNFNFYKDRQKLRAVAQANHAKCVLLWVQTPKDIAKERATVNAMQQASRPLGNMSADDFERLTNHLEEPHTDEPFIAVDGTKVSAEYLSSLLVNN